MDDTLFDDESRNPTISGPNNDQIYMNDDRDQVRNKEMMS
jgi:hypothetical protein